MTETMDVVTLTLVTRGLSESKLDDLDLDDFPLDDEQSSAHGDESGNNAGSLSDIEFLDEEDTSAADPGVTSSHHQPGEKQLLKAIASAMKRPEMRRQLGQVLPILRSMSPAQKLALATILTSRLGVASGGFGPQQLVHMLGSAQQKELMLPLSMDIANMFQPGGQRPEAMELRHQRGPAPVSRLRDLHLSSRPRPPPPPPGHNRRNAQVSTEMVPPPLPPSSSSVSQKRSPSPHVSKRRRPSAVNKPPPPPGPQVPVRDYPPTRPPPHHVIAELDKPPADDECDYFTNNLCLEVTDYPDDAIMASIHRNKGAIQALLADYTPNPESEAEHRYQPNRRQDVVGTDSGALCPSMVKYARPKRARATSGQWKFVVNVGDYTQTLRLEMCTKPHDSCSFISENFRSTCTQIFNYHRLLTWDESRGLHMDIFKVPTCCSCHVQGYAFNFPPRNPTPPESSAKREEFPGVDFATSDDRTHLKPVPPRQETPAGFNNFHNTFKDNSFHKDRGVGSFHSSFEDNGGFSQTFQDTNFGQVAGGVGFQNTFDDFRQPFDGGASSSFQETTLFHGQDQDLRGPVPQPPQRVSKPVKQQPFQRQGFRRPTTDHLVPPIGSLPLAHEDDFPPFTGNQIRRSRNQTVLTSRPEEDLEFGASQRRPNPHIITSDLIRSTTTTTTSTTLRPKAKTTAAVPAVSTDPSHRRVNYNYHPIIDFFKNQEPNKLEARQGQEWTPIIGNSQPRAASSTE
ncbi:uncharacterized protein NT1 [Anabrus simplex]|uniref:uncharacterized protein NT1 n=1 Tax=Anabrus simplex TaxID=316456 RepID=UPI0035A39962